MLSECSHDASVIRLPVLIYSEGLNVVRRESIKSHGGRSYGLEAVCNDHYINIIRAPERCVAA